MQELLNENEKLKKRRLKAGKSISLRSRRIDHYNLLKTLLESSKVKCAAYNYVLIVHKELKRTQSDRIAQLEVWLPEGKPHDARINELFLSWCREVGLDAVAATSWSSCNWGTSASRLWILSTKQKQTAEFWQDYDKQRLNRLAEEAEVSIVLRNLRENKAEFLRTWLQSSMPKFIACEHMISIAQSLKGAQAKAQPEVEVWFSAKDDREEKACGIFRSWCHDIGLQTHLVTDRSWSEFGLTPSRFRLKIRVPSCPIDSDRIHYELPYSV
jgi:hypothetical protein